MESRRVFFVASILIVGIVSHCGAFDSDVIKENRCRFLTWKVEAIGAITELLMATGRTPAFQAAVEAWLNMYREERLELCCLVGGVSQNIVNSWNTQKLQANS